MLFKSLAGPLRLHSWWCHHHTRWVYSRGYDCQTEKQCCDRHSEVLPQISCKNNYCTVKRRQRSGIKSFFILFLMTLMLVRKLAWGRKGTHWRRAPETSSEELGRKTQSSLEKRLRLGLGSAYKLAKRASGAHPGEFRNSCRTKSRFGYAWRTSCSTGCRHRAS